MLNLALNARDAMPAGGELTFATEAVELDEEHCRRFSDDLPVGRYLQICVTDTGVGMDGETAKHVFEPFFTTKGAGGTGMGLAAVYGTVRSHQGAIDVRTELGQGTTFCICLPLASTQERGDDSRGPADEVARAEVHVLLVDDEPVVRDALGKLLRRLGYRVTCCDNGAEGLEIYRKSWETIALVILDMVMPVMSGRETFAAMLEVNPDIVAVLSSGYSVDGEAEEILAMGVKAFIQKPFGLADLSRQLSAILGDAAPRTLG